MKKKEERHYNKYVQDPSDPNSRCVYVNDNNDTYLFTDHRNEGVEVSQFIGVIPLGYEEYDTWIKYQ